MRNSEKEKFKYYFKFSHSGFLYQEKVKISKILMGFFTLFLYIACLLQHFKSREGLRLICYYYAKKLY